MDNKQIQGCSRVVVKELCDDWINKNVYPLEERAVLRKVLKNYEIFRQMCKEGTNPKFKKIDESVKKTYRQLVKWTTDFNNRMVTNAYDI